MTKDIQALYSGFNKLRNQTHSEFVDREAALRKIQPSEFEIMIEVTPMNIVGKKTKSETAQSDAYSRMLEMGSNRGIDYVLLFGEQALNGFLGRTSDYILRGEFIQLKEEYKDKPKK
jgi:hypothetical protein